MEVEHKKTFLFLEKNMIKLLDEAINFDYEGFVGCWS